MKYKDGMFINPGEDFIQKQSFNTEVNDIEHQIIEIPQHKVPLMQ